MSDILQKSYLRIAALTIVLLLPLQAHSQQDLTRYVDPFIGTGGHGHTFPGAIVPFGMVQLSPDTRISGWDGCSGYHYSDNVIYGFSHTHLSGTGISDYGDILFMPTVGNISVNPSADVPERGYASRFNHDNENASPGYYSVRLDDGGILVELTATARAGFHRYTYPATNTSNLIIDLTHRDRVLDSGLTILDDRTIVGWRESTGWAKDQIIYFAAQFSEPFIASGIMLDEKPVSSTAGAKGRNVKAFVRFDTRSGMPVLVKVGISATSIEGAKKNLEAEISGWDFDKVRSDAAATWNAQLNKITVSGGTAAQLKTFYTALYHAMTAPNLFMDVDGKYLGLDHKIHEAHGFDNYTVFSLWDTFRAAHPLYTIIDQKRTVDFIQTFLAQFEQGGRLPVWELAANETDTMIGYHAVSVIADAAAKGIRQFDLEKAFIAMKRSGELKNFGLAAYRDHGFIELEEERESVSKTLEYAYDDWCIAQVARILGHSQDYDRYIARAQYYKNLFDVESGFMRPRTNGGWLSPFDPREVNSSFTEANSWQYTFFVPQDINGLMALMGGKVKFANKLDQLFSENSSTTGRQQADITGLIGQYAHGNEPSHHMAYLYNYAGQPWKTQRRVRQIMDGFYRPTPDGLVGNEDCGQMSAWYVLSAAGFYPVTPGSTTYTIGTPLFPEVRFNLENGKSFTIKAPKVSQSNIYIQGARLNGKPYQKSYFTHSDLMAGGELILEMGGRPGLLWGRTPMNIPVSGIDAPSILRAPLIDAAAKTFKDTVSVKVIASGRLTKTFYTTDGSEPGPQSQVFVRPFDLSKSSIVKAVTIDQRGQRSAIVTARFQRIPHNWTIRLTSKYSQQYNGGGDLALIDGIRGSTNWTGGAWQGYQGHDLDAVIDLGQVQSVTTLGVGFLQNVDSWIWMPRKIDFEVSVDGQSFVPVLSIANDVPDGQITGMGTGVITKDLVRTISPRNARYVRIHAFNYGKVPDWHAGAGGDTWLFADEVIVK